MCDSNLFCIDGQCKDDPCRYVQCPTGSMCTALKGTCVQTTSDGSGTGHGRNGGGCHFAPGEHPDQAALGLAALVLLAAVLLRRRRTA
jgi:MYXO-CTERM domain-containing protein